MKFNKWTLALAGVGLVSFASGTQAEEQHSVMTALCATTLSGYVDTSASWRFGSGSGALAGHSFDGTANKQDGFNLNAVKLVIEKPLDEGQWSAGYKADLVFGPDANYYGTSLNNAGTTYADDFAVKQAYVALRAPVGNGIDFKMGVWDTIVGYEVFESGNNPNFSRSYGYNLEPTHHTGLLASYKVNDWASVSGGIANSYAGGINERVLSGASNAESQKAYLGSLAITVPENNLGFLAGSTLYLGAVHGKTTTAGAAAAATTIRANDTANNTLLYAGATINTPVTDLSLGYALDYRTTGKSALGNSPWAWANAVYASYKASDKLKLNVRGDWAQGTDGTFYTQANGEENELLSLTATADYSLWANVISRAELRWDHAPHSAPFAGNKGNAAALNNAVTLTGNVIYKF